MHAADHALPREIIGTRQQRVAAFRNHSGQQPRHDVAVGCVAAGIGQVSLHVADAGLQARLDFIRAQTPEALLCRAHVGTDVVFHVLDQAPHGG